MALLRLDATLGAMELVPDLVAGLDARAALCCLDGDTVVAVAARAAAWRTPVGVWLEVSSDYPASMVARDVATLSRLVALDTVVVSAEDRAEAHAQVVDALLGGGPVDLANDVARLSGAYNRPVPPRPVAVWWRDGRSLRRGAASLDERGVEARAEGSLTLYA